MTDNAFDAITRRAADVVTRRSSVLAMGGAALAAVAGSTVTQAGKAGKKAKKKCKRQRGPCLDTVELVCTELSDPGAELEECIETFTECCGFLAKCQAEKFFECVLGNIS